MFKGTYRSFDFTARPNGFDYSNGSKCLNGLKLSTLLSIIASLGVTGTVMYMILYTKKFTSWNTEFGKKKKTTRAKELLINGDGIFE